MPYRLSDLDRLLDEIIARPDRPESRAPCRWLKRRLGRLAADPRLAFMFGQGLSGESALELELAEILARLVRIPSGGKPVSVVELAGVPAEVRSAVVSVLCRATFELASCRGAPPLVLVCEEAERYALAGAGPGGAPAARALRRIAEEGRAGGLALWLLSRRPAELAPALLARCATICALRLTGARDQETVRGLIEGGAGGLLDFLPALGDGAAIVAGAGLSLPLRVRLDRLPPERRPQRAAIHFPVPVQGESVDQSFVAEVVARWRRRQDCYRLRDAGDRPGCPASSCRPRPDPRTRPRSAPLEVLGSSPSTTVRVGRTLMGEVGMSCSPVVMTLR